VAVLILVLAGLLAQFVAGLVHGATGIDILGTVAHAAIIVYAVYAALTQLGIAVQLTVPTFLILLGAVALAATIAFGWGARNVAQDIVESAYARRHEARQRVQQQQLDRRHRGRRGGPSARPLRREE
jgi:hypothetical protein